MKNSLKSLVRLAKKNNDVSDVVGALLTPQQVEVVGGGVNTSGNCNHSRCEGCSYAQQCPVE